MSRRKGTVVGKAVIYTDDGVKVIDCETRRRVNANGDINEFFFKYDGDYLLIGSAPLEHGHKIDEALKYAQTKIFRLMIDLQKAAQFIPIHKHNCPMEYQYWHDNNPRWHDIDFSKTVEEIDAQFYRKYGFTQSMIDFVEERYSYDDICHKE